MKIRKEIKGVAKYIAGKPISEVKRELGLDRIVKMASNENPLGCSNKVKEGLINLVDETYLYPDASNYSLINEISNKLGVAREEVFLGGGSSSLIKVICNTLLDNGDESIMADLTFALYENYTRLMGAIPLKVPMKDMKMDIEEMVNKITKKTKIIWFCNPNNPTGTIFTKDEFLAVLDRIPEEVFIVMDEAYIEYVTDKNFPDSLEIQKRKKNFIILRTLSKAYGLASLRVGYGIADKELVAYFNRVINPFEINLYAQTAALIALQDNDFIAEVKSFNKREKNKFYDAFDKIGLKYIKSEANFMLVNINGDDKKLSDFVLSRGFIIRPGFLLGCAGYIRISLGTEKENIELIELLKEYFSNL